MRMAEILDEMTPVQKFYDGTVILVTGGTGFMGKVLIEKLLHCCPTLKTIYVLVRSKKGRSGKERIREILRTNKCFERVRNEMPGQLEKVKAVEGDCEKKDLDISDEDRNMVIANVNVVFHVAATVRFDNPLPAAIRANVMSTKAVLDLCHEMRDLRAVIHVSTAYSNCVRLEIAERIYDPPIDCDKLIQLFEMMDERTLVGIEPILLGEWPNTYAYTKCVAEHLIKKHYSDLPICIIRPSIVCSAFSEPLPGWADNMYGAVGLSLAAGTGLVHIMLLRKDAIFDFIPVDYAINAIVVSAAEKAAKQRDASSCPPPVITVCTGSDVGLQWGHYVKTMTASVRTLPLSQAIWPCHIMCTSSPLVYNVALFFTSYLKALIIDLVLILRGEKPRLRKLVSLCRLISSKLYFFCNRSFHFGNEEAKRLEASLDDKDRQIFPFIAENFPMYRYLELALYGVRHYILNDTPDTVPKALRKMKVLDAIHTITKWTLISACLYACYLLASMILV